MDSFSHPYDLRINKETEGSFMQIILHIFFEHLLCAQKMLSHEGSGIG